MGSPSIHPLGRLAKLSSSLSRSSLEDVAIQRKSPVLGYGRNASPYGVSVSYRDRGRHPMDE